MSFNQELEVTDAKELLDQKGFEVVSLEKIWRNITGHVKKDGLDMFFKLAVNPTHSGGLKNEFAWNELFEAEPLANTNVQIPKNYVSGEFKECFWFACEYIAGKALVEPDYIYVDGVAQRGPKYIVSNPAQIRNRLPEIAQLFKSCFEYKTDKLLPYDIAKEGRDRVESFWKITNQWVEESGRELSPLVDLITEYFDCMLVQGISHGDFVPWHLMVDQQDRMYLIDAERGQIKGIKFFDLAYMYHRLFAVAEAPQLANALIAELKKIYDFSEEDKRGFYAILAQRVIAGYAEAIGNPRYISVTMQDLLSKQVLAREII